MAIAAVLASAGFDKPGPADRDPSALRLGLRRPPHQQRRLRARQRHADPPRWPARRQSRNGAGDVTVAYDIVSVDGRPVAALGLAQRKGTLGPPIIEATPPRRHRRGRARHGDASRPRQARGRHGAGPGGRDRPLHGRVRPSRLPGHRPHRRCPDGAGRGGGAADRRAIRALSRAFANEVLVRFADGVDEGAAVADLGTTTRAARPPGSPGRNWSRNGPPRSWAPTTWTSRRSCSPPSSAVSRSPR